MAKDCVTKYNIDAICTVGKFFFAPLGIAEIVLEDINILEKIEPYISKKVNLFYNKVIPESLEKIKPTIWLIH